MITVKLFQPKKNRTKIIYDMNDSIANFINNKIDKKVSMIDDFSSLEVVASDDTKNSNSSTKIELMFKKTISLKDEDFSDKLSLDMIMTEVKNFCEQSLMIEKFSYKPIHLREREKNANK